jgi:hypothetical protein
LRLGRYHVESPYHLVTEDLPDLPDGSSGAVQPVVRQLSQRSDAAAAASTNAGMSVFNERSSGDAQASKQAMMQAGDGHKNHDHLLDDG